MYRHCFVVAAAAAGHLEKFDRRGIIAECAGAKLPRRPPRNKRDQLRCRRRAVVALCVHMQTESPRPLSYGLFAPNCFSCRLTTSAARVYICRYAWAGAHVRVSVWVLGWEGVRCRRRVLKQSGARRYSAGCLCTRHSWSMPLERFEPCGLFRGSNTQLTCAFARRGLGIYTQTHTHTRGCKCICIEREAR